MHKPGTTLLELVITMVIFGMVIFGFYNIQVFSDYQVVSSSRKAQLQNEAALILEHMAKYLSNVTANPGSDAITFVNSSGVFSALRAYADSNANGMLDTDVDSWLEYNLSSKGVMTYCANLTSPGGASCQAGQSMVLSKKVISNLTRDFVFNNTTNFLDANLSLCWNPAVFFNTTGVPAPELCGQPKNPRVQMKARIPLLSVSAN